MSDDGWVKAATANDNLVVDLLLHIKYSSSPSPPPSPPPQSSSKELNWIVRQRRSKTTASNQGAVRVSPTTPLSLTTCATSQSGGTVGLLDGSEESSRQPPGSKVTGSSEPARRPKIKLKLKKKKTMGELKMEEDSLLRERSDLKNNISSFATSLGKKQASFDNLLRMKMDFSTQQATASLASEGTSSNQTMKKLATACGDPYMLLLSATKDDSAAIPEVSPPNTCTEVKEETAVREKQFVVPDLNVALEETSMEKRYLYGR